MTHALDLGLAVATISAIFYVALGAWVLTLTPRRRQTLLLAAFAILFGMDFAVRDLGRIFHLLADESLLENTIQTLFQGLASLAALGLALSVPEPLEDRRLLGTALALGFAVPLVDVGLIVTFPEAYGGTLPVWVRASMSVVRFGVLFAAIVLFALRANPEREPSRADVTQIALLGVALVTLYAFVFGASVPNLAGSLAQDQPAEAVQEAAFVLYWALVAGLWGWNMVRADDDTVRIHRTATLAILGLFTGGALYVAAVPGVNPEDALMRGVVRTLGVGLLAYGVLRHDLAGLDAKVEYGVSKTTVAGIFVAVFFAASEGAQVLFADFAGNELIGVAAAALLVFAISPLQRLADRFAAKAVPGGAQAGAGVEDRYREAVRAALVDDVITEDEERHLARRADELGIGAERAYDLRREVEDEVGGGDEP